MKVTVVCGLLGAGKTTFIQHFLKGTGEKTVVLVNDFGSAGIDGEILSSGGIESIELPSGCVCCTLKFDLMDTVRKVIGGFAPAHLVVEPSGVATVSGILEALETLGLMQATVVGIIDATEFMELYESGMYGRFFEDQIVNSDVLLINKADLAEEVLISRTEETVCRLNPGALIFRTVKAALNAPLPDLRRETPVRTGTDAHLRFETLSLPLKDGLGLQLMQDLFRDLSRGAYGAVARAKALVRTGQGSFRLDLSYGKADCTPFEAPVTRGRVVIIGNGLNKDSIARAVGAADLFHKK